MKHRSFLSTFALLTMLITACKAPADQAPGTSIDPEPYEYALVLHGGAGSMNFENVPEPDREIFKHALDSALQLGLEVLQGGGTSLDAVEVVIRCMEDNPLFQCRKRSCFYQ